MRPANPNAISAVAVLERSVDAFCRTALVVAGRFRGNMADQALAPGFIGNFLFAPWCAARVDVDDRGNCSPPLW